jgi:hypothetical protein
MSYNTPEGRIKKKVIGLFKELGVWYFMPMPMGYGKAGIPDFVGCVDGFFIGVECKADKTKKPTVLQIKCGDEIRQAGGVWLVVDGDESLETLRHTLLQRLGFNKHVGR